MARAPRFGPPLTAHSCSQNYSSSLPPTILPIPSTTQTMSSKTSVPYDYINSTHRYTYVPTPSSSSSSSSPPTSSPYDCPISLNPERHALQANYILQSHRTPPKPSYKRAEQLKAGEMRYYPGRDEWLVEWGRVRRYGVNQKMTPHESYVGFLKGEKGEGWKRGAYEQF
ncbi:hypothetical protein TrST_g2902 [Triparma strigata]|uniref:Uncharacterized protein n=1 Tax=Triparma strigata TaxID=1606541 RepID=A0A9W7BL17_9STRA|nr:hypothetical protein TrST_g2902 [Triparma strigata]